MVSILNRFSRVFLLPSIAIFTLVISCVSILNRFSRVFLPATDIFPLTPIWYMFQSLTGFRGFFYIVTSPLLVAVSPVSILNRFSRVFLPSQYSILFSPLRVSILNRFSRVFLQEVEHWQLGECDFVSILNRFSRVFLRHQSTQYARRMGSFNP